MHRPVPEVPREIAGPCVYGHLLTQEHVDNFRRKEPDIPEWESDTFDGLVSVASLRLPGRHSGHTALVFDDEGEKRFCLMLVGHRNRSRVIDWRWGDGFMTAMEDLLGITGQPKWYPCVLRHQM